MEQKQAIPCSEPPPPYSEYPSAPMGAMPHPPSVYPNIQSQPLHGQIPMPQPMPVVVTPIRYGPDPVRVKCVSCHSDVMTETSSKTGNLTWILAGLVRQYFKIMLEKELSDLPCYEPPPPYTPTPSAPFIGQPQEIPFSSAYHPQCATQQAPQGRETLQSKKKSLKSLLEASLEEIANFSSSKSWIYL
ncbi:hypothetical protein B4U79_12686 [Dinothrombium tinctorium]|uniref:LITAF domain-containing protein n=1 Tax=Dinothrombium tinctorium TaxID=1965070 RepID=A0A3S3P673_9ACAR|nr:hypothetical protein B4U79_11225 [Dinothrombium tinctorium]RWS08830.1 hypothetical protein B4U79_02501 [Dinothrombium tinctorium]RWS08887.1 hypothetical protein B4U79_12686 [Dinothrombium tinctorium]